MRKKSSLNVSVFLLIIFLSSIFVIKSHNSDQFVNLIEIQGKKILGEDLFGEYFSDQIKPKAIINADDEPIFWDVFNGSEIIYNPVVLFVNYYYWDALPFYDDNEEYVFEMYANESTIFNSSYIYSRYNEYYWWLGYDWNVSIYEPGTLINVSAFFYQENNPNLNHTASILVTIGELKETPTIDFEDFTIDLQHFAGTFYTGGAYWVYNPTGPNPYYHFAIFPDGYVELKYGEQELYQSNDLTSNDARGLMQDLIDLGFFQLKALYQAPDYDYYYSSWYYIEVESKSVQEWRSAEEAADYIIRPVAFSNCLQAIKDRVDNIYFEPLKWKWRLFFIISGSSLGGLGVLLYGVYVFTYRRRR